MLYFLH